MVALTNMVFPSRAWAISASAGSTPRSPMCVAITESAASLVIRKPLGCKLIRGAEAGIKGIRRAMRFGRIGLAIERGLDLLLGWLDFDRTGLRSLR